MMMDKRIVRPAGEKPYKSLHKHYHNSADDASKWISRDIEERVFNNADYGSITGEKLEDEDDNGDEVKSWVDSNGNMWGFLMGFDDVGTENQQFGFFDSPVNQNDDWHGFPVLPFTKKRYRICKELIIRWVRDGLLKEDEIPSLKKGLRIRKKKP